MEMNPEFIALENYFLLVHKATILEILLDPDLEKHYSININFAELFDCDTNLGNEILKEPEEALKDLDEWILYIQDLLIEEYKDESQYVMKYNVHARVHGLPPCPELHRSIFPRNEDVDLFLQITGTVIRVTGAKMLEYQRDYRCAKCKHIEKVQAIYDQKYIIPAPKKCANSDKCPGKTFMPVGDLSADNCKDYQEIKIQEQSSKLNVGIMPSWMWVTLDDDLVDTCKPGDDVTICGTIKRRWGPLIPGKKIDVALALKANHVQINNEQAFSNLVTPEIHSQFVSFWEKYEYSPLVGRDFILKSFCPKIYGMYLVKLAVAMILAGGSRCKEGNEVGIQIRSEPHILLVGDPGTGKSQLLRYAAKVIPRSILTTGVGTTTAGLTVAAIMEDGQWQLEGGALVLADGGICCIDEFNSMKSQDRTSIHEAMEQQTISVAKASIVCKLNTRCSILAATNPKGGHLDSSQPLSLNLTLPSPLLSRFDLILLLKDSYDKDWDEMVSAYILRGKTELKSDVELWNLEMLQQYFAVIRKMNPILTEVTNKILSAYYQAQRDAMLRNKARTTVRLLDSLVRLSQAHAKLMFHKQVQTMDTIFAIVLIETSMHSESSVLNLNSLNIQANFNDNPMQNYTEVVTHILNQLGLYEILNVELISLKNKYQCQFKDSGGSVSEDLTCEKVLKSENISIVEELEVEEVQENKQVDVVVEHEINFESPKPVNEIKAVFQKENDFTIKEVNLTTLNTSKMSNTEINDCNVINLIPSANDGFDLSVLNYTGSDEEEQPNKNNGKQKRSTQVIKFNIKEKFKKFHKRSVTNEDSGTSFNHNAICPDINKVNDNDGKINVNAVVSNSENSPKTQVPDNDNTVNTTQAVRFSESVFEASDEEIDYLDLDF